jgi:hypothetical protein
MLVDAWEFWENPGISQKKQLDSSTLAGAKAALCSLKGLLYVTVMMTGKGSISFWILGEMWSPNSINS